MIRLLMGIIRFVLWVFVGFWYNLLFKRISIRKKNGPRSVRSWVCCLQVFNLFQIIPKPAGCIGDQLLISGREQYDLQLAVFEIPPADYGSVY